MTSVLCDAGQRCKQTSIGSFPSPFAAGVSAGETNGFKLNRIADLARCSLGIPRMGGGGFLSLKSGQISEGLQMQNLGRE